MRKISTLFWFKKKQTEKNKTKQKQKNKNNNNKIKQHTALSGMDLWNIIAFIIASF